MAKFAQGPNCHPRLLLHPTPTQTDEVTLVHVIRLHCPGFKPDDSHLGSKDNTEEILLCPHIFDYSTPKEADIQTLIFPALAIGDNYTLRAWKYSLVCLLFLTFQHISSVSISRHVFFLFNPFPSHSRHKSENVLRLGIDNEIP